MKKIPVYTLGDSKYYLLEEVTINGINYLYLSNVVDEGDFMLRKRDLNDFNNLVPLDNENEVKMAALVFANKMLED